jgi:U3 small nucleolar RNA-associated protein 3
VSTKVTMGGGKSRRNTAKTGDKSLYSNREQSSQIIERNNNNHSKFEKPKHNSDDLIYDEVDQFHNNDYLRLDHDIDDDDDSDEDGIGEEEVMRLENDEDSHDDDDDDAAEEESDSDGEEEDDDDSDDDDEERIISSDDDNEEDDDDNDEIRDWGAKKMAYYYGDTADLEIGQEVEEALLEEDAAKDVLNARYQDMTEDDFMINDDNEIQNDSHRTVGDSISGSTTNATTAVNMTLSRRLQLSTKEKRQLLNQQHHQEFIPLLSYFTQKMIAPYTSTTRKATNAIFYSNDDDSDQNENTANVSLIA